MACPEHSRLRSAELVVFSTGKRTVVCHCLGQELEGNFFSPRQRVSIKPLHPRNVGEGHRSWHLCLPTEGARQVFWEPEPHPVNQSINGSQYPQGYFHIGNTAPVDVKLSPGMPAAAHGTGGWSGLRWSPWDGSICSLWQLGEDGSCYLMGFGYYLFRKMFLLHSVLHKAPHLDLLIITGQTRHC